MAQPIIIDSNVGNSTSGEVKTYWSLPNTIEPVEVLPDRYTKSSQLLPDNMKGKESDPGRMGIYVCLLDDKPHLHPSLSALHKHRYNIHRIPIPPDPTNDLPIAQPQLQPKPKPDSLSSSVDEMGDSGVTDPSGDIQMSPPPPLPSFVINQDVSTSGMENRAEWFMWKFSEEELLRRKSYLPLA
ncbi:uncharacterized protein IL334_004628 [Kwoniella shivajii]|uniref:Uncharacterized protein n=1 Tax=Kwoniella shivajii TaxID=564305 RepID=A0ABZ1D3V4_9TREE|nr:hypothetical protein IL334_004628 [Kwoniella shivajii]